MNMMMTSDRSPRAEDRAMIRAAAELTRELSTPNPWIYWSDMLASAALGYGAMVVAILAGPLWLTLAAMAVSVLALYRAGLFVHEISHLKLSLLPGFWLGWHIVVGIPLLLPSFMYEGLHNLHHAKTRYGTVEDPEYLPLALMKPWTVPLFVLVSMVGWLGLLVRYGLVAPLSLFIPPLRRLVVARYSGLVINPEFRRRPPEGEARTKWLWTEAAASLWAITLVTLVATGVVPVRAFVIGLVVMSLTIVLNQIRTLVAHLWANDGAVMSVTDQFLDSVNVPGGGLLPALWAPVGLRYHALHHLIPSVPYHALGEAHRRLTALLEGQSPYHRASYPGLPMLVGKLVASTFSQKK